MIELLKSITLGALGLVALAVVMAVLDHLTSGISTGVISLIVAIVTGAGFLWCIGITIQGMIE